MIACIFASTNLAIDAGIDQALGRLGTQEQMIDAQPGVPRPTVSHVIPERVHRRVRVQRPDRIGPALVEKALKQRAALRLEERILGVGLRRIDIAVGRYHVVVTRKHHGDARAIEFLGMPGEPLHPSKLVREFGTGLRVAVRRVERRDQHAAHGRLDIAALGLGAVARQLGARNDRLAAAGEDRDSIP